MLRRYWPRQAVPLGPLEGQVLGHGLTEATCCETAAGQDVQPVCPVLPLHVPAKGVGSEIQGRSQPASTAKCGDRQGVLLGPPETQKTSRSQGSSTSLACACGQTNVTGGQSQRNPHVSSHMYGFGSRLCLGSLCHQAGPSAPHFPPGSNDCEAGTVIATKT